MTIAEILKTAPLIPVVTLEDAQLAPPLVEALLKANIKIIEITLRTPAGLAAIQEIRKDFPQMMVGAGTVLTVSQFKQVMDAGAHFAVSPGFTLDLLETAKKYPLPYIPSAVTPSEMMAVQDFGIEVIKFFPAAMMGGVKAIQFYQSVFPKLLFCPTGGVTAENMMDFLNLSNVIAVGGSWLAPAQLIKKRQWEGITQVAHESFLMTS